jgi:hypothetical protein
MIQQNDTAIQEKDTTIREKNTAIHAVGSRQLQKARDGGREVVCSDTEF